jgi:hypothetical protein
VRSLLKLIHRGLFGAVLLAGCLAAACAFRALPSRNADRPALPPVLAKYLGRPDMPPALEPDPRTKSGPSVSEAMKALGSDPDVETDDANQY